MTLVAHLTPGHTRGCTTWTFNVTEGGKTQSVLIIGSVGVNPGMKLVGNTDAPQIEQEFERSFKWLRAQHPDIPLGSHPGMYNMNEKFAKTRHEAARVRTSIQPATPPNSTSSKACSDRCSRSRRQRRSRQMRIIAD